MVGAGECRTRPFTRRKRVPSAPPLSWPTVPERPSALRIDALLALLGTIATVAAALAAVVALLPGDDAAAVIDHAHEPLLVHLLLEWPLVAISALLALAVLLRGGAALRRDLRARRAIAPALAAATPRELAGASVRVIDDPRPLAFCAGLWRPRIHVSSGAVAALDAGALGALLAHEAEHARRRDPLRRVARELVATSLFFLPVLRQLAARRAALAELRADAAAVAACDGDARPLARALLAFDEAGDGAAAVDPARVDELTGVPSAWTTPAYAIAAALGVLALVLAMPVVAVEHTTGHLLHVTAFGVEICAAPVLLLTCLLGAAVTLAIAGMRGRGRATRRARELTA